jgi:PAS domain S-box-containing protein
LISPGDLGPLVAWCDEIKEGFFALDTGYRIIAANEHFLTYVGLPRESVLGQLYWNIFPGSETGSYGPRLRAAMEAGLGEAFEIESVIHPGGIVRGCAVAIRGGGLAFQFREITGERALERLRARQAEESESRLRLALEATSTGIWQVDFITGDVQWDARSRALFGLGPDDPVTYDIFLSRLHPEDRPAVIAAVERAREPEGAGELRIEHRVVLPHSAEERWITAHGRTLFDDGRPVRIIGTVRDVTARRRTEEALRAREAQLDAALEAAAMADFEVDYATGRLSASRRLNALFDYPPDHPLTVTDLRRRYHPEDDAWVVAFFRRHRETSIRQFELEFRLLLPNGRVRWVSSRGSYARDPDGRTLSIHGVAMDVTERKLADERRQLLLNELNHRVKNTLATVQSIVSRTVRGSPGADDMRRDVEERLFALSRAHDVLTRENWESANLTDVVVEALRPYVEAGGHLTTSGPDLRLAPSDVLGLSMALHELATNAAKYGALSAPSGRVEVAWRIDTAATPPRLVLTWEELGGPLVEPPQRQGFGTRLIARSLAHEEDATVDLRFPPEGAVCTFVLPLRSGRAGRP